MTEEKEIFCIKVDPSLLDGLWDKCLPFLSNPEIGDVEFASLDDIKASCEIGEDQLWILMQGDDLVGAFNTNFGEVSKGVRILNIYNLSGAGAKVWIKSLDEKVSKFAIDNGCILYMCIARRGFSKLVPELKEAGTTFIKDLRGAN